MDIEEAVKQAITEAPARKFSESVDLAINLHNIDLSLPGNRVDAEVILPHGLGKADQDRCIRCRRDCLASQERRR